MEDDREGFNNEVLLGSPFIGNTTVNYLPRSSYRNIKSDFGCDFGKNCNSFTIDYHKSSLSKHKKIEPDGCKLENNSGKMKIKDKQMVFELINEDTDEYFDDLSESMQKNITTLQENNKKRASKDICKVETKMPFKKKNEN